MTYDPEYDRQYRENNRERIRENQRRWRENNGEHIREYRNNNQDRIRKVKREWRHANPDLVRGQKQRHYYGDLKKSRARERERSRQYREDPAYNEYHAAYLKEWRKANPDYEAEWKRNYWATNPKYRKAQQIYTAAWHATFPNYNRIKHTQTKAFAQSARQNLRSLMMMDPRITKLINSCIDLSSASDAEVRRFYRGLERAFAE